MQKHNTIHLALAGALAVGGMGMAGTVAATPAAGHMDSMGSGHMIKCYGVNAAHKNDCNTPGHSCAGLDSKARDPNAYVEMPKGLCGKLAGGSLKPADTSMMQHKKMMKDGGSMGHA